MDQQIPKRLRSERVATVTELETELRGLYYRNLVGRDVELLVESARDFAPLAPADELIRSDRRLLRGTTCRYAPAELIDPDSRLSVGDLIRGRVVRTDGNKLSLSAD
jgi:hypothetical protein